MAQAAYYNTWHIHTDASYDIISLSKQTRARSTVHQNGVTLLKTMAHFVWTATHDLWATHDFRALAYVCYLANKKAEKLERYGFDVEKGCSLAAGVLILALTTGMALAASSFPDVDEDAPYAEAVEFLNSAGIMVGDAGGNFNPDTPVTRAQMAVIVCRLLGETEDLPSDDRFSDVPIGHWANGYVSRAAELGIVNGYGDGRFGPSEQVTYEQAVAMIVRVMGQETEATLKGGYPSGYIAVAEKFDLLQGVNCKEGDMLSRSNVSILIYNLYSCANNTET